MTIPRWFQGSVLNNDGLDRALNVVSGVAGELQDLHTDALLKDYKTSATFNLPSTYQALDTTNLRATIPSNSDPIYKWVMVTFQGCIGVANNSEVQIDVWNLTSSVKLNGWTGTNTNVNDVYGFHNTGGTIVLPFNVVHFVPYNGATFQVEVRGNYMTTLSYLFNYFFQVKFVS